MGKKRSTMNRIVGLPLNLIKKIRRLNRNAKLAIILVAILCIVGVWAVIAQRSDNTQSDAISEMTTSESIPEASDADARSAKLVYEVGVVEQRDELGEWTDAIESAEFISGMALRTVGANSRAIIEFTDGSIMRLDANTEITFDQITTSRIKIEQESGYAYNRVIDGSAITYQVLTKSAQFEAKGTAFRTIATGDEEAVEVYQSSVRETINNKTVKEGQKLVAKNNVNPGADGTVSQIDIELLKEDDFVVWNREQDKSNNAFKTKLGFLTDFDGPKIDVTDPIAGSSIQVGQSESSGTVSIKGMTEKGTKLTVQSKSMTGSSPVDVTVGDDGNFDTGSISAPIGNSIFEFVAKDRVGNTTKFTVSYTFKRQVTTQQQGIVLVADTTTDSSKISLKWSLVGISTPDGLKILRVKGDAEDLENTDVHSDAAAGDSTWSEPITPSMKGDTYSYAVCRFNTATNACDITSNTVTVTIPKQ
jgi:hypothetical protein